MEKIYTLKELEGELKLSNKTLLNYIKSGRLKAVKMGSWRVSESNLQEFIQGQQGAAASAGR